MYLFQRAVTLTGGPRRSLAWAAEMTALVNEKSGFDASLWVSHFGMPLGTVIWSGRVESRAQFAEWNGQLIADPAYLDLVETGLEFVASRPTDYLRQLVHPQEFPPDGPPPGSVATLTTAQASGGNLRNALGWGVEVADLYARLAGSPALFFVEAYGAFSQITWIAVHADMAAADAAAGATSGNAEYLESIDGAGDFFIPGTASQALATRIV